MNEAETRAEHIDPALKAAGWGVVEGSRVRREVIIAPVRIEGLGRRGKAIKADYVLEYRNTKLAVVEAKAWSMPLTEGLAQAKNYCGKLAVRFGYATNGQGIYAADMQNGNEAEVSAYPTPDELWARTFAKENAWRDHFAAVPYEDKGGSHPGRYYQDIAIERVLQAVAAKKTRFLLTLATGTGKTFIAFQIVDFVLQHYVSVGVEELDQEKLTPLLRLRYHKSIADAVADLGDPEEIGQVFFASSGCSTSSAQWRKSYSDGRDRGGKSRYHSV